MVHMIDAHHLPQWVFLSPSENSSSNSRHCWPGFEIMSFFKAEVKPKLPFHGFAGHSFSPRQARLVHCHWPLTKILKMRWYQSVLCIDLIVMGDDYDEQWLLFSWTFIKSPPSHHVASWELLLELLQLCQPGRKIYEDSMIIHDGTNLRVKIMIIQPFLNMIITGTLLKPSLAVWFVWLSIIFDQAGLTWINQTKCNPNTLLQVATQLWMEEGHPSCLSLLKLFLPSVISQSFNGHHASQYILSSFCTSYASCILYPHASTS